MNISGGEMKKRNTLRALGAVVVFAVLGLLSACESFEQYEPEGGRIEFIDMGVNDAGDIFQTFIVIKSSKLPEYSIYWTPDTVTATTDNGRPFGNNGTISSTTTLIFTGTTEDSDDLKIYLDDICMYPYDPYDPGELD